MANSSHNNHDLFTFLTTVTGWQLDPKGYRNIVPNSIKTTDSHTLFKSAEAQGVCVFLNNYLKAHPDTVSNESHTMLNQYTLGWHIRNHNYIGELKHLKHVFEKKNIQWMTLKGAPLSQYLFQNPSMRISVDLDLWVNPDHFVVCYESLIDEGYTHVSSNPFRISPDEGNFKLITADFFKKDVQLFHPEKNIMIELHWRLEGTTQYLPTWEEAWAQHQDVTIENTTFSIMSPAHLFLHLSRHGSVHTWTRLSWLADIVRLCDLAKEEEIHAWLKEAKTRHLTRSIQSGLHLIDKLWGIKKIKPFLSSSAAIQSMVRFSGLSNPYIGDKRQKSLRHHLYQKVYRFLDFESMFQRVLFLHRWVQFYPVWSITLRARHPYIATSLAYLYFLKATILYPINPKKWKAMAKYISH